MGQQCTRQTKSKKSNIEDTQQPYVSVSTQPVVNYQEYQAEKQIINANQQDIKNEIESVKIDEQNIKDNDKIDKELQVNEQNKHKKHWWRKIHIKHRKHRKDELK